MIIASFYSLFWVMVLLVTLLYMFAVVLTQASTDYRDQPDPGVHAEDMRRHFGSLFTSGYSLFKAMTGGQNWGELADLIWHAGFVYFYMLCVFMFFSIFSFLNII